MGVWPDTGCSDLGAHYRGLPCRLERFVRHLDCTEATIVTDTTLVGRIKGLQYRLPRGSGFRLIKALPT